MSEEENTVLCTVYQAKLAEQAEQYDEMVSYMKEVVKLKENCLDREQRNLLSVAYKNVIGAPRASWRILTTLENSAREDDSQHKEQKIKVAEDYRKQVEKELDSICTEVLEVVDNLIEGAADEESKVFYYKMKGDYCRYMAEFRTGEDRKAASDKSNFAYGQAQEVAENLATTHPIRLGLALNFSVFHFEIDNNPKKACEIAKNAFDKAITDLDKLHEDQYKDSTLIMQLLRDNLTLWTSDLQDEPEEDAA